MKVSEFPWFLFYLAVCALQPFYGSLFIISVFYDPYSRFPFLFFTFSHFGC